MPDVAVIGAGPAGSAAALLLARRGWHVTLVEQHRFPRDKVCGECVSRLGVETLRRLGLLDELLARGAIWLRRANLFSPDGNSTSISLPTPMLGVSRSVLDACLLEAARAAGAQVLQPARCEQVTCDQGMGEPRPLVRVRDLATNRFVELTPDRIVIADGKPSVHSPRPAPGATRDFGIKAHFHQVDGPRDAIELFGCRGSYGGLAPVEGDRWNAAFSVPASWLSTHGGDISKLFEQIVGENPRLTRRMREAKPAGPWLAAPLPRYPVRANGSLTILPVGNAAAALEPIGGEGMGLALRSAEIAVEVLTADPNPVERIALKDRYNAIWRVRTAGCRAAGIAAAMPGLANLALPFIASQPHLTARFIDVIGK